MKLKRLVTLFGAIIIIFVGGLLYVSRNLSVLPDRSSSIREELNNVSYNFVLFHYYNYKFNIDLRTTGYIIKIE